jgi:hypothetical protein
VERGSIVSWDGLEALLHDTLYGQVQLLEPSSTAAQAAHLSVCNSRAADLTVIGACMQLGCVAGEEGYVLMSEPLFQAKVRHL